MSAVASNYAVPARDNSASRLAQIKHRIEESTELALQATHLLERTMNRLSGRPVQDDHPKVTASNAPQPIEPTMAQIENALERQAMAAKRLASVADAVAEL